MPNKMCKCGENRTTSKTSFYCRDCRKANWDKRQAKKAFDLKLISEAIENMDSGLLRDRMENYLKGLK